MANIKISDLTAASAAADANEFEINEAGTSKKVTGSQIKAFVNAGDGALASKNTVGTADIDNLAVTNAKLGNGSVTSAKIATDTITAANIAANAVGASELNVTGNGTSGQYLASDGDGTMTWTTLAGGGGAWEILSRTSLSSTASVIYDFGSYTDYDAFKIILSNVVPTNDGTDLDLYVGSNGGSFSNTGEGNYYTLTYNSFSAVYEDDAWMIASAVGSASLESGVSGEILVSGNIKDTSKHAEIMSACTYITNLNTHHYRRNLQRTQSTTEDSIRLAYNSGFLESGTITLLGLKQS